jgi:predicted TIM-barrel fold metal-dependent hydrolase
MRHRTPVIDADGHVVQPDSELYEYLDPDVRRGVHPTGAHHFFPALDNWMRTLAPNSAPQQATPDAEAWGVFLDRAGIDLTVVYPSSGGLGVGQIRNPDWAIAVCYAYNNWLHDRFLRRNSRMRGAAMLPLQDVSAAVEELRRATTELGMVVGMLAPAGLRQALGDPLYDPLYAEAQRLDVPLAIHTGSTANMGLEIFDKYVEAHTLGHPFGQMIQFTSVMWEGVPERFPRLRLAFLEAGAGWVPYLLDRMDEEWEKPQGGQAKRMLAKPPRDYVRDGSLYFSCELDERTLPYVAQFVGEDHLFYASDFPHELQFDDFLEPIPAFLAREDMSETLKAKILAENARRFYRLGAG